MTEDEIGLPVALQIRLLWAMMGKPMDLGIMCSELGLVVEDGEDGVRPEFVVENG